jgi:hypothetical protein
VTAIDELLSRALLLEEPSIPRDIVPCPDDDASYRLAADSLQSELADLNRHQDTAAHDLQALCEAIVTHTAATSLKGFITEQLPEPSGARVLGCILQLTDVEDGARVWWQYAAGAGDSTASYCLYLYHLALGESDLAALWREQTGIDTQPDIENVTHAFAPEYATEYAFDSSMPTVLRILGHLITAQAVRPRTDVFDAVMDYVPCAVTIGYLDPDPEIIDVPPLPAPDFADHIGVILSATTGLPAGYGRAQRQPGASPRLRRRQPGASTMRPGLRDHARGDEPSPEQPVRGHR